MQLTNPQLTGSGFKLCFLVKREVETPSLADYAHANHVIHRNHGKSSN